jgi:hypothetical protein
VAFSGRCGPPQPFLKPVSRWVYATSDGRIGTPIYSPIRPTQIPNQIAIRTVVDGLHPMIVATTENGTLRTEPVVVMKIDAAAGAAKVSATRVDFATAGGAVVVQTCATF